MKRVIIISILLLTIPSFIVGCAGTGFEKRCTLVPDSFGISVGQYDNKNCPDGWPTGWNGITINATWNLK